MPEPRRPMPEPTYHWPGGPTADDDPTPAESALAALKIGAILAAGVTIVFFYLATYSGYRAQRAGSEPRRDRCLRLAERPGLPQDRLGPQTPPDAGRQRPYAIILGCERGRGCCVFGPVPFAKVAELVDAPDLGSGGETLESSSLSFRTTRLIER